MTITQTNKWLRHKSYGSGEAIAFVGDERFVEKSLNFASCFLMNKKTKILNDGLRQYIMTKRGQLERGLALEGLTRAKIQNKLSGFGAIWFAVQHVKAEKAKVENTNFLEDAEKMR